MQGTMDDEKQTKDDGRRRGKKRKSDCIDGDNEDTSTELNEQPELDKVSKKKPSKSDPAKAFQEIEQFMTVKEKDRRKNIREARPDPVTEFEQMSTFFGTTSEKAKIKKRRSDVQAASPSEAETSSPELKEERKALRRAEKAARKLEKAAKLEKQNKWTALVDHAQVTRDRVNEDGSSGLDEEAERRKRKALKKQRKAEKEAFRAQQAETEDTSGDVPEKRKKKREKEGRS